MISVCNYIVGCCSIINENSEPQHGCNFTAPYWISIDVQITIKTALMYYRCKA